MKKANNIIEDADLSHYNSLIKLPKDQLFAKVKYSCSLIIGNHLPHSLTHSFNKQGAFTFVFG